MCGRLLTGMLFTSFFSPFHSNLNASDNGRERYIRRVNRVHYAVGETFVLNLKCQVSLKRA